MSYKIFEYSSVSTYEYATLLASMEALINKEFNCTLCQRRFRRDPKRSKLMRGNKGCFGITDKNYRLENISFSSCVGNYTSSDFNYYLELFGYFEKGVLPYLGTISDQPAKIIEIFDIIRHIKNKNLEAKNGR